LAGLRPAQAAIRFTGVNLFGAEFGVTNGNLNLPGTYGQHYIYPTAAEVGHFVGKGMNTFRLPFRWERMQRSLYAPLDGLGGGPIGEIDRLDAFVNAATAAGAYVILDPHNFQRYQPAAADFESSAQGLVGSAVPNSAYANFWGQLATHYRANQHVIFNLMNEPNTMPTAQLVTSHNAAIAAIRQTGAQNLILVPGNQWTGAWLWNETWYQGANATHMLNIVDPANNFAFDVHQYFDADGSGTSPQIGSSQAPNNTNIGVERLTAFTNWLHTHHRKGFLGEFALAESRFGSGANADGPQIGDETLRNTLNFIQAHSEDWLGWTWWAAGPWDTEYMFSIEPGNLGQPNQQDSPVLPVLTPYLARVPLGDANLDGKVNAADYTVWRNTLGQRGAGLPADFNIDGVVNMADHGIWKANFRITGGAGGAVPESASLEMLAIAALLCGACRRRKRYTIAGV
jgi:endoglucanase